MVLRKACCQMKTWVSTVRESEKVVEAVILFELAMVNSWGFEMRFVC